MKRPSAGGLAVLLGCALASSALAQSRGPDVIVGTLYSPTHWTGTGSVAGFQSYSIGTYSCNRGDKLLSWIASTPAHPVIGQNLFRYSPQPNGGSRFEQISQSWLKHGFTALQGSECNGDAGFPYALFTANPAGGVGLGWGASDPYSSSLNGGVSSAGPKSNINATTGVFAYPIDWSAFPGGVQPAKDTNSGSPDRRLKVAEADLTNFPGAHYFFEGQYVQVEDAGQGNRNNSASWVEASLNSATLDLTVSNPTTREQAGIQAWATIDSAVKTVPIDVPGDGRFWLAWRITNNNNGTWDYEYAIQNLNSDRSGASFTVPFGAGSAPTNTGAHYVPYHSGEIWSNTPWTFTNQAAQLAWSSPATFAVDPKTNALRWGTLYNFRFTASTAPVSGTVSLGLFKPGSGAYAGLNQMIITADVPGGASIAGAPAPINNACSAAVPMYGDKIGFSTAGATSSGPNECSAAIANDIWFSYTVPAGCAGSLSVDTTGSSFASRVAVYATCPGSTSSAIACSASLPNVSFNPTPGATYLIRVGGANNSSGDGVLTVTPACPSGACCNASSQCQIITATACADMCAHGATASYGGDNSSCTAGCATFAGACCNATTGACSSGSSGSCCSSSGIYQGNGSSCTPTPCPGAGRCCNSSTGACTVILQGACTGAWTSADTCTAPCAGTASCCNNTSGACSMVFSSACTSGSTFTNTSSCSPSPCPVGACCSNAAGSCSSSIQTACTTGSSWFAAACTTSPCPQPPPPANDLCSAAIWLADGIVANGSSVNATFSAADGNGGASCGSAAASPDVWYKYLPTTSATCNINTCGSYPGFDSVLSVHTGSCGSLALFANSCNDDSYNGGNTACGANNLSSGMDVPLVAGTLYYIRVAGYNNATGVFPIRIIGGGGTVPTPPANDDCANRQGVGVGAPIAFNTSTATTDGPIPSGCSMTQLDKDIWYNYPAQTTGNLTVSTCGSTYDTRIAIYHTSLCNQINDSTLVGCNDDFPCSGGTAQSQLTIPVVQGDSYTIRIGGKNGAGGAGAMLLSVVTTVGSCCDFQGQCHTLTAADCFNSGAAFGGPGSPCLPSPCPQPGACCNGTACSVSLPASCTGNFQGAAVACGTVANPTTCCAANFNQIGGLSVPDIFDFLAAWFASDPRADINGGGLSVQDIFAFLNLWFSGC